MAAEIKQIHIDGLDGFIAAFNAPWNNKDNHFSNPRIRVTSCVSSIIQLLSKRRNNDAQYLFTACKELDVWNPSIGAEEYLYPVDTVTRVCQSSFQEALRVLSVQ